MYNGEWAKMQGGQSNDTFNTRLGHGVFINSFLDLPMHYK